VHVRGGAYDGATDPGWLQGILDEGASWLDVSACIDEQGWLSLVVVNVNEEKDFEADLKGGGKDVQTFTVSGPSVKAVNIEGKEEVGVKEGKWNGEGKYSFAKHSMTMLRWQTGEKIKEVEKGEGERLDTRKMAWS